MLLVYKKLGKELIEQGNLRRGINMIMKNKCKRLFALLLTLLIVLSLAACSSYGKNH